MGRTKTGGAGWIVRKDPEDIPTHGDQCRAAPARPSDPNGPWLIDDLVDRAATLEAVADRFDAAAARLRTLGDRSLAAKVRDGRFALAA
jgi:hypothetical protein